MCKLKLRNIPVNDYLTVAQVNTIPTIVNEWLRTDNDYGEPSYHKFYCSQECTERKVRRHFEKRGYFIDTIAGIWEE